MKSKLPPWLKHPAYIWTAVSLLLFVLLPWLITVTVRSDAGMAACFILFYAIDPVFAIAAGMFAGKDPRRLWFVPLLVPALFLLGTRLCFAADPAFVTYALMYLLLGGTTMFVFLLITNGRKK